MYIEREGEQGTYCSVPVPLSDPVLLQLLALRHIGSSDSDAASLSTLFNTTNGPFFQELVQYPF